MNLALFFGLLLPATMFIPTCCALGGARRGKVN